MGIPNFTFALVANPVSAPNGTQTGDCLVANNSGAYVLGTSAARGTKRCSGVTTRPAGVDGMTIMQTVGDIVGLLDPGTASLVRVSAAGRLERVTTPSGSDDVVGLVETTGLVHLFFGLPWQLLQGLIGGGAPGAPDKSAQYRINSTTFGGMGFWTYEGAGRLQAGPPVDESGAQAWIAFGNLADTYATTGLIRVGEANALRSVVTYRWAGSTYAALAVSGIDGSIVLGGSYSNAIYARGYLVLGDSGAAQWAESGDVRLAKGIDDAQGFTVSKRNQSNLGDVGLLQVWCSADVSDHWALGANAFAGSLDAECFDEGHVYAKSAVSCQLTDPATVIGGNYQGWLLQQLGAGSCVAFYLPKYTNWAIAGVRGTSLVAADFGGGQSVGFIGHAVTVPTTNPTSGVLLYVDPADGHLKYRKASGAVIDLG